MKLTSEMSVSFKKNSRTHYVLKYVKFKGGYADVTMASSLFKGRIPSKSKARVSVEVLVKDGCLVRVDGDVYQLTPKGLSVVNAIGRNDLASRIDPQD